MISLAKPPVRTAEALAQTRRLKADLDSFTAISTPCPAGIDWRHILTLLSDERVDEIAQVAVEDVVYRRRDGDVRGCPHAFKGWR